MMDSSSENDAQRLYSVAKKNATHIFNSKKEGSAVVKKPFGLLVGLLMVALAGCSTIEEIGRDIKRTRGYPNISNTVKQGCLGGFTVGVLQAMKKKKKVEKVLRDGVIGAVLGCTIAEGLDRRRENFSSDAEHFDAEIADAKLQNKEMQKLLAHTQSLTKESRLALKSLTAAKKAKQLEEDAVAEARTNARADLRWAKGELKTAKGNLEQRQETSERMVTKGEKGKAKKMNGEIRELERYVNSLESEVASLAAVNDSISQLTG